MNLVSKLLLQDQLQDVALQATAIWTDRRYLDMSVLKPQEVAVTKAA
jgi:hypothetical protein